MKITYISHQTGSNDLTEYPMHHNVKTIVISTSYASIISYSKEVAQLVMATTKAVKTIRLKNHLNVFIIFS